jgi:PAS domain S-box-containing protein
MTDAGKIEQEEYRTLFETMAQGVVYQEADGRIIECNPAAERILGLTRDQMQGRTPVGNKSCAIHEDGSLFPSDSQPSMVALRTGQKVNDVIMGVFNPKSESYRWINVNAVPLFREKEEKPYRVYTTFEDISFRFQVEEELRRAKQELEARMEERTKKLGESEEKFKTLSEKSLVGIYIIQDDTFKYINPAFARMFDYTVEELMRLHFRVIVAAHEKDRIWKKMEKLISGKIEYFHSQFEGIRKNGKSCWLEVFKAGITLEGRPAIIGSVIDITRRKQFEEALQEKSSQLETLNRELERRIKIELEKLRRQEQIIMQQSRLAAMGEMVGAIAHQWRQPITTVGVILQNLNMAYKLKKIDGRMLEEASRDAMEQINYMSKTIDDFRDFFVPSKQKESFSVIQCMKDTISLLRTQMKNNAITIHCNFKDENQLTVSGYPGEFKQVLVNIFNNARNAIVEERKVGGLAEESGDVYIKIAEKKGEVVIEISNNGSKIPKTVMNRIFEPYFTTGTEGKGMGIGLYMSKIIVENQMNGRISAKNTKQGVLFTIRLEVEK